VSFRCSKKTIEEMDQKVKDGHYMNKSDFARRAILKILEEK
jgi:Arc/MetJ-type ribon-helix-helix transcriptional regulator